jgi:hypothetical protein
MIDMDMMILQNHTNSGMEVRDPCGETDPTSRDASQAINIKVEAVSDAEEEKGPVQISFPKIKVEPEVRRMSLDVQCKKCPLPIPTKHLTALWFPTAISPYWDVHVFSCYFTGYSH